MKVVRIAATGTPIAHQARNDTSTPSSLRMKARPMRFGGVPIGVARPPMLEAKATASINPVAKRGSSLGPAGDASREAACSMAARIPAAIATIIAVVAVLEMKALIVAETSATAARIRPGRSPTAGRPRTANASRRSRP